MNRYRGTIVRLVEWVDYDGDSVTILFFFFGVNCSFSYAL